MSQWAQTGSNDLDWERLAHQANYKVTALAVVAKSNRRALHRHFVRTFGQSPQQWLVSTRLRRAKTLLLNRYPIKAVAYAVGFRQENNFYPFFRRHTGQTPAEFLAEIPAASPPSSPGSPSPRSPTSSLPGRNWHPSPTAAHRRSTDSVQLDADRNAESADRPFGLPQPSADGSAPNL